MSDVREQGEIELESDRTESLRDEAHVAGKASCPSPLSAQAYRSVFNQTLAPPNAPLARVVRPPNEFAPESKRAQLIDDAEMELEEDMDELKRAVHDYNVDFQRRIDDVKARGRCLEDQIRSEYEAMEESMVQLQREFTRSFQTAFVDHEGEMLSRFARVEAHDVSDQQRTIHACEADARHFFYSTVPEVMESLQGSITRKLAKHHETFDIENAKTQKRERKTLATLESSDTRTAAHFRTERQRRHAKFREREEAFHHAMRVDDRASETQQTHYVGVLTSLQAQLSEEQRVRQAEDGRVLDTIGDSFHRLQSSILENLGEQAS